MDFNLLVLPCWANRIVEDLFRGHGGYIKPDVSAAAITNYSDGCLVLPQRSLCRSKGVSFCRLPGIPIYPFFGSWIRRCNRIAVEFDHDSGGHFPAHEKPRELAEDLRKMFGKGGCGYGVVSGKDGYT